MAWEVDAVSGKRLSEIAKFVKESDGLILATDPDREEKAISWHVLECFETEKGGRHQTVQRVVFNAITKKSVTDAMAQPRDIDHHS